MTGPKTPAHRFAMNTQRKDNRVTVIHQENGGIAKAQNTGLDAAHGEYIAFADNDDILDRHNIEYLLHALQNTGADMSKARWRQFGVSQLDEVAQEAAIGVDVPNKITVFEHPLAAYQTVFCKSLRLIGDKLGHNTEARYFNEANWCRLYKRKLWDGIRFPEGMYAQDVMVAGELYTRMGKVADLNVNLYNWLQSAGSVTHKERSFSFCHDNFAAGAANFRLCLEQGVRPGRSYYTLVGAFHEEITAPISTIPQASNNTRQTRLNSMNFSASSAPCNATLRRDPTDSFPGKAHLRCQNQEHEVTVTGSTICKII